MSLDKAFIANITKELETSNTPAHKDLKLFAGVQVIALLFAISLYYLTTVFFLLPPQTVVFSGFCFLFIVVGLSFIFNPTITHKPNRFSLNSVWLAAILLFVSFVLINSLPSLWHNAYYTSFPLLETEMGMSWHQDSVFHTAIINSFTHLGYPSIGQHDAPVIGYHVLSHFMDSLIIQLTGADAWESYGLFFQLKTVALVIAILVFTYQTTRHLHWSIWVLSLVIAGPIIINTGHIIGSHGLWFTSLLILLSAPKVFDILRQENALSAFQYLFLFVLLIFISVGKVSSGLLYAAFIGFVLLQKHAKDYRVYLLGIAWLVFFGLYNNAVSLPSSGGMNLPTLSNTLNFLLLDGAHAWIPQVKAIYLSLFVTVMLFIIYRNVDTLRVSIAGFAALVIIAVLIQLREFTGSDIWYFVYGLYSFVILHTYQCVLADIGKTSPFMNLWDGFKEQGLLFSLSVSVLLISMLAFSGMVKTLDAETISPSSMFKKFNEKPFERLNNRMRLKDRVTFMSIVEDKPNPILRMSRPLQKFREDLLTFMKENGETRSSALLYIPSEIYGFKLGRLRGQPWALGKLMYAITGVPMLHGLQVNRQRYGHSSYDDDALWRPLAEFDPSVACKPGKNIIIAKDIVPAKFSYHSCSKQSESQKD